MIHSALKDTHTHLLPKPLTSRREWLAILIVMSVLSCGVATAQGVGGGRQRTAANFAKIPLSFEANQGQMDRKVKFLSRGDGYSLSLTSNAAILKLRAPAGLHSAPSVLRMELLGASPEAQISGTDQLPGVVNYFIGSDPKRWHANIGTYAKVRYQSIYPGVDTVFYGNQRRLEYDFVVAIDADPSRIALGLSGVKPSLDAGGNVVLKTAGGDLLLCKPVVYQGAENNKKVIEARYLVAGNTIRFKVGKYDHKQPLIIDPQFDYMTYLGGSGVDQVGSSNTPYASFATNPLLSNALAVDTSGNTYVVGTTSSANFPTQDGYEDTWAGYNGGNETAFVSKINPTGTGFVYSTYLGGSLATDRDQGCAIAVDASGDAYVVGSTLSPDFPTTEGAYQRSLASLYSAFVTELNPAGNGLVYSTYLGAPGGYAAAYGIALDANDQAYVSGNVSSVNNGLTVFPTSSNALLSTVNNFAGDGFVTVFNAAGTSLVYSTLIGDDQEAQYNTSAQGIAVDPSGNFYVTGITESPNMPVTTGAFQTALGTPSGQSYYQIVAFAAKFGPVTGSGNLLTYLTYLRATGTDYEEYGAAVTADSEGNAYVAGNTYSPTFPTTASAYQTTCTGYCAFVTKLNPSGTSLAWSTLLGGNGTTNLGAGQVYFVTSIALDVLGNVYVAGGTSSGFPSVNPVQPNIGTDSAGFITKIDPTGSTLLFSSMLGDPTSSSWVAGSAVDALGNIYVGGGVGNGSGLPVTAGAPQASFGGGQYDGWVAKIHLETPSLTITKTHTGTITQGHVGATYTITVSNIGDAPTNGTVTVTEAPPAELTVEAMSGSGWTCTALPTCTRTDPLAGGGASYAPITVTVNVAPDAPSSIVNGTSVSGGGAYTTPSESASDTTVITPVAAPDMTIAVSNGSSFSQGQTGAIYAIVASNSGTAISSGIVAVSDTVSGGLTLESMTGMGWSCATLPVCNRTDPLAAGSSYPPITVTVNVASNAPTSVTEQATVSGGGETDTSNDTALDVTTVIPSQQSQTITFPAIPTQIYPVAAITLNATASSGLPVSYSVLSGPASVSGSTLTITGGGSVTVQANQAGNASYSAAPPVSLIVLVDQAPAITSGASSTMVLNTAGSMTVTATGFPIPSLVEAGALPNGVSFLENGNGTGTLSGAPTTEGIFNISFTASNEIGGPALQSFTLTVAQAQGVFGVPYSFGPTNGGSPQLLLLGFTLATPTTFGPTSVVTQGTTNLDYTLGSTTCVGTLPAGSTCFVTVIFSPLAPGLRMGGVELTNTSGGLVASTLISGIGLEPAIAFGPGVQSTVVGGSLASGVDVDAAGNIFIAQLGSASVLKVQAGGGTQTTVGTGLSSPYGVAVDGAGDLFIADSGNNRVVEVPAAGGVQLAVGSGFLSPSGVAVDGAGDVFIADSGNNRVVEVPVGGGAQITVGSGLSAPRSVAVDGAGDVFIADSGNNRVVEVPAAGGVQLAVGSGLLSPSGVAVDGAGDVIIADSGNNRVIEVSGGGAQTTVGSGFLSPSGVAMDGQGDIFITDISSGHVVEVQRSQPPSLSFATTPEGATSSDSPQSVIIQNIGNQALSAVAPGLIVGADFVQVPGTGTPADCTSSFSLAPGATCNLSISFEPQSIGGIATTAVLTDNALDRSPSVTQGIALQGTGTAAIQSQTITFPSIPTQIYPAAAITLRATASSGLPVSYAVLSGPASVSGSTLTITGGGSVTIQASQAGNASYSPATPASQIVLVDQAPTITSGASATMVLNTAGSVTVTATGFPIPSLGEAGALPTGLHFQDHGNGTASLTGTPTTGGVFNISFTAANGIGSAAVKSFTLAVNQAPSITSANSAVFDIHLLNSFTVTTIGTPAPSITRTGSLPGGVSFVDNHNGTGTLSGTPAATGAFHLTFSATNGLGATATQSFTLSVIVQANQNISFPSIPNQAFGAGPLALNATASSGLPVSYMVISGPASISGNLLTMTGLGSVTVQASQTGNVYYAAATPVSRTFNITQAHQSITFSTNAPAVEPNASSFTVVATASSGLPVSFSSSGVCSNVGALFTMTSTSGTCRVIASQAGNADYLAAATVTEAVAAERALQTITFTGAPASALYQSTFAIAANSNSGISPTISAAGACSISGLTVSMSSGTGTCTLTANWPGNANYLAATSIQTTIAAKLTSTVSWPTPASIGFGTALSTTQLNATSSVPGSLVYTPAIGTVPPSGSDLLSVTFTPSQPQNYTTVTTSVVIQVIAGGKITPTITWPTPAAITYGTALSGTQLNARASITGSFVYSPAAGTVLNAGTQTLSVTFTPTDLTDYTSATVTVPLLVNKATTLTSITAMSNVAQYDFNPTTTPFTVMFPETIYFFFDVSVPASPSMTSFPGTVTVRASSGETCTAQVSLGNFSPHPVTGVPGSCFLNFNTPGYKTVTATYGGDSNDASSTSIPAVVIEVFIPG